VTGGRPSPHTAEKVVGAVVDYWRGDGQLQTLGQASREIQNVASTDVGYRRSGAEHLVKAPRQTLPPSDGELVSLPRYVASRRRSSKLEPGRSAVATMLLPRPAP